MASKYYAKVNEKNCVACGSCVLACVRGAVQVIKGSYARIDERKCVGCGLCAKECPTGCIARLEREELV